MVTCKERSWLILELMSARIPNASSIQPGLGTACSTERGDVALLASSPDALNSTHIEILQAPRIPFGAQNVNVVGLVGGRLPLQRSKDRGATGRSPLHTIVSGGHLHATLGMASETFSLARCFSFQLWSAYNTGFGSHFFSTVVAQEIGLTTASTIIGLRSCG